jgi:predicted transcriptional regulator
LRLLDEHGDAIEADLQRHYRIDLCDFYRGELSPRRLGVLIRYLPVDSALVAALNDGKPGWALTDHLLADLWALTVRTNSEKGSLPEDFDHPARAEVTARERLKSKLALKEVYLKRKRERRKPAAGGEN